MTLILTRASKEFVLQVTDRLLMDSRSGQPWDRVANKNVLYIASNAIVAMAYAGDAYLDAIPLDYWIVERLLGIRLNPQEPPGINIGEFKPKQDLGQAIRILCGELTAKHRKRPIDLRIVIQGWQWDSKRRCRPIAGFIANVSSLNSYEFFFEPRDWWYFSSLTMATPKENVKDEEMTRLRDELRGKSVHEVENILVRTLRDIARGKSFIGPHCISILLPPPSNPNILIKYHPADSLIISQAQALSNEDDRWGYSPWIVGPNLYRSPSQVIGGGFGVRVGRYTVLFESPVRQDSKYSMADLGQKRKGLRS